MATRNLKFGDKDVAATDIGFQIVSDGAVTLELEDGAKIRIRPIVLNVMRTDEKSPEGERLYIIQSINQLLTVEPAKEDVS